MELLIVAAGFIVWLFTEWYGGRTRCSPGVAFWLPKAGLIFALCAGLLALYLRVSR